jgi:hypothetical protein
MLFSSIVFDDTCYKVAGVTVGHVNNWDKTLIGSINLNGELINYELTKDSDDIIYGFYDNALIKTSKSEFAFTGYAYDSLAYLLFGVTKSAIDSISIFRYPAPNTSAYFGQCLIQKDNYYYLAGVKTDSNQNDANVLFARIDSAGNKLYERVLGLNDKTEQAKSITQLANGNLLIGAERNDYNAPLTETAHTWLIEMTTSGSLVRQWLDPNDSTYAAYGLLQTADGGFIYAAQKKNEQTVNSVLFVAAIIKLDNNFNKQWEFTGGYQTEETAFVDVVQLADGSLVACGKNNYREAWIIKLSATGQVIWDKKYVGIPGMGSESYLTDIDVLPDGNLVAVGQCTSANPLQVGWFLKLDSNGCELESCLLGVEEMPKEKLNTQLQINPNPFTGNLSLTITNANVAIGSANITLTNPLGQTVYHQQVTNLSSNYTKMLDLSYLPNGVYFIAVEVDGERTVRQVVKQ